MGLGPLCTLLSCKRMCTDLGRDGTPVPKGLHCCVLVMLCSLLFFFLCFIVLYLGVGPLSICCSQALVWTPPLLLQDSCVLPATMTQSNDTTFTILSWNVRGLNSKFKRALLFCYLKSHSPRLILLQETHLMGNKLMAPKPWLYREIRASYSTFGRGVSVLISKSLPWEVEHVHTDPQGRYVLVVLTLWSQRYIVMSVYVPSPLRFYTLLWTRLLHIAQLNCSLWETLMSF